MNNYAEQSAGSTNEISIEILELEKKQAETDSNLNETLKSKILEYYNQAILSFHETDKVKEQLKQLKLLVQSAPDRIKQIREQLVQIPKKTQESDWTQLSIEQIEQQFKLQEFELQQSKIALKAKEDELNQLIVDSKKISEQITFNNKTLQAINQDLISEGEENPSLQKARLTALNIRKALRQLEIELGQTRFSQQDLLTSLAQSERNLLVEKISHQNRALDVLLKLTQQRREFIALEARKKAELNQHKSNALHPELQHLSDETTRYRIELENLLKQEIQLTGQLNETESQLDKIKADYKRIQQRVNILGATNTVNKLLRKSQQNLPTVFSFRENSQKHHQTIAQVTDRQLEIDDLQRNLADKQSLIEILSAKIQDIENTSEQQTRQVKQQVSQHLQAKIDALNELQKLYGRYITQLSALILAEQERIDVANSFSQYIDSQLWWIPNGQWQQFFQLDMIFPGLAWFVNSSHVEQIMTLTEQLKFEHYLIFFLGLCVFLMIIRYHNFLVNEIHTNGLLTRKVRTDSFILSLKTLIYTLLLALPLPVLLICSGLTLQEIKSHEHYINNLGDVFIYMGLIALTLNLIRQICRSDGLGIYHLRWSKDVCNSLSRDAGRLLIYILPLVFLVSFGIKNDTPASVQLLGGYAYIFTIILVTLFTYKLLRAKSPLIQTLAVENPDDLLVRLHFIWFPLLMLIAFTLLISVIMGYQYTVWQLQQQLEMTIWFLFAVWIIKELLLRWLYITGRRFRFEEALRYKEELKTQRNSEINTDSETEKDVVDDIPNINYSELSEQARRLLYVGVLFGVIIGLWLIWREWLPSVNLFFQTELPIYSSVTIDGISKSVPLTLANLITALLTLFITILAAKNLPGVLEITLLQHLPIDPGARYAISTLSQYVIVGIGIMIIFTNIGMEWSNIQWLVAALSVGLGFGLQEIVANFISGIILLFERPIRVGDYVTVGESSGTINKINIRATTITNFDRQELLIPNKEFITGRVLNWTLSNKLNRVIIEVGIAYDSDLEKAMELLTEAACESTYVLEDPEPSISFDQFGDSALLLTARCYLENMDNRLLTKTEVNKLVLHKFRRAGIEIAFPQRDIHIDAANPLSMRIIDDKGIGIKRNQDTISGHTDSIT